MSINKIEELIKRLDPNIKQCCKCKRHLGKKAFIYERMWRNIDPNVNGNEWLCNRCRKLMI